MATTTVKKKNTSIASTNGVHKNGVHKNGVSKGSASSKALKTPGRVVKG